MINWMGTLRMYHDDSPASLAEVLDVCLTDPDTWTDDADDTDLYPFLALCWPLPALRLKIQGAMQFWPKDRRETLVRCLKPYLKSSSRAAAAGPDLPDEDWVEELACRRDGIPLVSVANLLLLFARHDAWAGGLWFDAVRNQPMVGLASFSDADPLRACAWMARTFGMQTTNHRLVETCMLQVCEEHPRDPLREWLEGLPAWDKVTRLDYWLSIATHIDESAYHQAVSRLLIVSLVARALDPGCQYRSVVILEGPEDTGKSRLIAALAGPEWTVELTKGLDTKEAHIMLEGAWVAELAELDSLSKTEETKLKAFITHTHDEYVPKYKNHKTSIPRRTVFVGSTNDAHYLKGESGNSRFLPVQTEQPYDLEEFARMRTQLFAEALVYYRSHPLDWWELDPAAEAIAIQQRGAHRVINVFEDALCEWFDTAYEQNGPLYPTETDLDEIAERFLQMDRKSWANTVLQKQILSALRALGFGPRNDRSSLRAHGAMRRYWGKKEA